ncbi:MAG: hypothetical protein HC828_03165 [Blastochloris sp.]|nr:hypothetical protein [Blastochloris sp.]
MSNTHTEDWYLSFPPDDPRFDELRTFLVAIKKRGRYSPVRRILAEYALLGFGLATGKIPVAAGPAVAVTTDLPDPQQVLAARQQIESELSQMEGFE